MQLLIGDCYHGVFWFHFNLIFLSIYFTIISLIFKQYLLQILQYLGVICLYFHFSGLNYNFFRVYRYRNSFGTFIELIPLTIIGCIYSYKNLISRFKGSPKYFLFILFVFIYFIFKYDIFIIPDGFRFPYVILNITASTMIVLFFGSLNFDYIIINTLLKYITRFTGGIYYIHYIFKDYFEKYILFFKQKTYFSSVFIYIISYAVCFVGTKVIKNRKIKY